MARKVLRVGFDFDGVIAYNPLRVFRAPVMAVKKTLFNHTENLHFPVPHRQPFRFFWALAHETSFFPSYGLADLKKLLEEKKIDAYIITGRYSFLEGSLRKWLKRHGIEHLFAGIYSNREDQQPHLFKEEMIKKLGLDMFVEDNWDIVKYLSSTFRKSGSEDSRQIPQIHWIYNIIDRNKTYGNKHPYLKRFIEYITSK